MDKHEFVMDALEGLDWDDSNISAIMADIFNSPMEAIEKAKGEFNENHLDSIIDTLGIEYKEEDEDNEE